ncbi:substrate-binding domain-containing protein [Flavobacterium sp. Sd200]|uniref:LacI family DNA-binding transcriptional regulator n=1 Tax=Flavobacterium sp. Sd200 TaxID=2692211 RepID=UPI0013692CB6|nr:LacI family DNA-binding transcriptional regulator [Flavobacterium sp. Sd200]MXN93193.1 substrate-binding domain-containing protein [Flavobacterium sp. Sd200]
MSNITIKDIAKALNLSVSTISKALNNSYEIGDETKQRVNDYAKANNYKPNRLAKSLKIGHTNSIGVLVCSYFSSTFLAQILDGIQKASLETGHDIIIMQSFENVDNEKACLDALISKGVDGILMAPVSETSNSEYLNYITQNHCPIVLFDRFNPAIETTKIGVNEYKGAFEATQHLININRKRILFITGDKFGENNQRILGFKKALKNLDIPFNQRYMVYCSLEDTEAMDAKICQSIQQLTEANIRPNAIFGATDVITTRTLGILANLKIKVPEDIAVIGFANTDIAFSLNPSLSTIRQPARDIGYLALNKLVELIDLHGKKPAQYETILLETTIQLRNSTNLETVQQA